MTATFVAQGFLGKTKDTMDPRWHGGNSAMVSSVRLACAKSHWGINGTNYAASHWYFSIFGGLTPAAGRRYGCGCRLLNIFHWRPDSMRLRTRKVARIP